MTYIIIKTFFIAIVKNVLPVNIHTRLEAWVFNCTDRYSFNVNLFTCCTMNRFRHSVPIFFTDAAGGMIA